MQNNTNILNKYEPGIIKNTCWETSTKIIADRFRRGHPEGGGIMVWRRPGEKPLSESMMVSLLTHICVTRPQWVNTLRPGQMDDVYHINGFLQKRHNSIALALELCLSCNNPFRWYFQKHFLQQKHLKINFKFYLNLFLGVQLMINQQWIRQWLGNKPLPETMMTQFADTHMCYQLMVC